MIYLDHLLEATHGVLRYSGKQNSFDGFSHDTRQVLPGEMFVAVRGERGDGHDYLLDAARRGATGLLVEARVINNLGEQAQATLAQANLAAIVVEDTRLALQHYARFILQLWHPTVIAVTGSVGKTSTKEAIATVLSNNFATFRSWQNYNDLLGLPLSLGRLEARHEYAVLELGCDHPGEIADLCRVAQPHIGVLTNISPTHLQYFGSVEQLASELGMLLTSLPEEGKFFYNQNDPAIRNLLSQHTHVGEKEFPSPEHPQRATPTIHEETSLRPYGRGIPLWVPSSRSHLWGHPYNTPVHDIQVTWAGVRFTLPTFEVRASERRNVQAIALESHLLGEHSVATMLAAYEVGRSCGMAVEEIQGALAQVYPLSGRLNPLPGVQHARLLDDTHNAAPAAVIAGLATLNTLTPPEGRRIAVLGDMQALGDYEAEAHRLVGQQAAHFVDYLVTRGERAAIIAESAQQAGLASSHIVVTSTYEDAAQAVQHILSLPTQDILASGARPEDVVLIKGSEGTRMERVTELLMAQPAQVREKLVRQTPGWRQIVVARAERPTWVEIDLSAIGNNTRCIKSLVGSNVQVLISLKADAYGHGALKVARTVLHNGATMLGVATVSEAAPLRDAGITAPILVFGYVPLWQMREAVRLGVTVTLYANESAQALSRAALALDKTVKVHVKIDTGMGRLGIRAEQMDEIVKLVREVATLPGLELEGLYTHLATADAEEKTYARLQLSRFREVLRVLEAAGMRPPLVHAANSAATLSLPEARFDIVRPGIAIYGLDPSPEMRLPEEFRPALSFKTQVAQVKMVPEGECISYGCTYITQRPTRIAVLPVGYADGFRRAPRNWGAVLLHGQEAPLLGRVCMDQCMVDVTSIPQTRMGDEVVLIGRQGAATLTAEQVAERLGTVNYEVVAEILARVPRVD